MAENALTKQAAARSGFIRAYGMYWSADEVDWDRDGRSGLGSLLLGRKVKHERTLKVVNFWDQRGIYILYNHYGPYYVGKTHGQTLNLGTRLRQHYFGLAGSPHKGKWNRFSWFGWRRVLTTASTGGLYPLGMLPKGVLTTSKSTVQDMENLLIQAMGTRHVGNRRNESFVAAIEWEQITRLDREYYLKRLGWIADTDA